MSSEEPKFDRVKGRNKLAAIFAFQTATMLFDLYIIADIYMCLKRKPDVHIARSWLIISVVRMSLDIGWLVFTGVQLGLNQRARELGFKELPEPEPQVGITVLFVRMAMWSICFSSLATLWWSFLDPSELRTWSGRELHRVNPEDAPAFATCLYLCCIAAVTSCHNSVFHYMNNTTRQISHSLRTQKNQKTKTS